MLFGMVATPFFSILLKKTRRYKYITFGSKFFIYIKIILCRYTWMLCVHGCIGLCLC